MEHLEDHEGVALGKMTSSFFLNIYIEKKS